MRLQDARTGWDRFDITLLRPQGWLAEHSRRVAGRSEVWVDFEELHAKGWAEVIEERPCPKIASGPGRVVTATITHANDDVRTLTLGSGEVLHVTGNHRMFSATRQDWVPVKDLEIGEALRTVKGRESVAALGFQRGRHKVYNIEVETEHCYFVGSGEVLTHNTCGPDGAPLALTHSDKDNDVSNSQGGRKGSSETREQNQDLADHFSAARGENHEAGANRPEKGIRGKDGSITFPDVTLGKAGSSAKTHVSTYDTNSRGGMTKREARAAVKTIQNMSPGSTYIAVPKPAPRKSRSRK